MKEGIGMELQFGRLTLRTAGAADAEQLAAWWNDGAVMAHAGFPLGLGITKEEIAGSLAADSDGTRRRLMILMDQTPIGEMSYRILDAGDAEIGIKICETAYQEMGLGRVALSLLIRALFERGCGKIVLDTNLNNLRAQHVYEKLGFQKIAVRRDSWLDQLGRPQSAVDYALTRDRFVDFAR